MILARRCSFIKVKAVHMVVHEYSLHCFCFQSAKTFWKQVLGTLMLHSWIVARSFCCSPSWIPISCHLAVITLATSFIRSRNSGSLHSVGPVKEDMNICLWKTNGTCLHFVLTLIKTLRMHVQRGLLYLVCVRMCLCLSDALFRGYHKVICLNGSTNGFSVTLSRLLIYKKGFSYKWKLWHHWLTSDILYM